MIEKMVSASLRVLFYVVGGNFLPKCPWSYKYFIGMKVFGVFYMNGMVA